MNSIIKTFTKGAQNILVETSKPVETVFNVVAKPVLEQPLVQLLVSWVVVVSIILAVKDIPYNVQEFLSHPASRVIITFLGLYVGTKNFVMSVIATMGLILVYHLTIFINEKYILEQY